MLTDVGEALLKAMKVKGRRSSIKLVWERDYFPWAIQIDSGELSLKVNAEMIGTSTWQSIIVISQERTGRTSDNVSFHGIMKRFKNNLGRPPWESPYWEEGDAMELYNKKGITLNDVKMMWDPPAQDIVNGEKLDRMNREL